MAQLLLLRHGESTYNKLGLWTGHIDVDLTDHGRAQARAAAEAVRHIPIHLVHTSPLRRTHQTFEEFRATVGRPDLTHQSYNALIERHYGIHTGKNKWQVQEEIGDEAFTALRRGWDVHIPEGETLKDVHARAVPHFKAQIQPQLQLEKNVLIVSHGNTLRALVKHLDDLANDAVAALEIATGEVYQYDFDSTGAVVSKAIHATHLAMA